MKAYHGASSETVEAIASGRHAEIRRAFQESNVSLGGTYVSKYPDLAKVYAKNAVRVQGGSPLLLTLEVSEDDLLPDEDWVVRAAESEGPLSRRLQAFMDDLFIGYPGEGFSLSDHYKERYDALNKQHEITWKDSWKWVGTARLDRPIRSADVIRVDEVS